MDDLSSEQSPSKEFVNAHNLDHPSPPSPEKPFITQRQLLFDKRGDSGAQESSIVNTNATTSEERVFKPPQRASNTNN